LKVIDAHQHFWTIGGPGQVWPDSEWPLINRDFVAADLHAAVTGRDVVATVLVQSQPDDRDTDWLFASAGIDPIVAAIVAWVDLARDDATARIATLAARPKCAGLRPMLQGIADTEWLMRRELDPAIEAMIAHGLRFDALVEPRHLPMLKRFAAHWPELPIVVDHGAKPHAASASLDPWGDDLSALAAMPGVHCKLSGLRTEQSPGQAADELQPYVDHLVACFGQRLMWGSDWPVLLHSGDSYGDWLQTCRRFVAAADEALTGSIFHTAASRFYGLDTLAR
jgi:L-fuconolactonase